MSRTVFDSGLTKAERGLDESDLGLDPDGLLDNPAEAERPERDETPEGVEPFERGVGRPSDGPADTTVKQR